MVELGSIVNSLALVRHGVVSFMPMYVLCKEQQCVKRDRERDGGRERGARMADGGESSGV